MSRCIDPKFEEMIYAYELGLLNEQEQAEFELHLYECDHCFERVREFQPAIKQLRENDSIKALVRDLAEDEVEEPTARQTETAKTKRWSLWPTLVPASLVVAIFLAILIFKPFSLRFEPDQEAVAAENSMVVLAFNNLADPSDSARLGQIVTSLLITDLSESRHLQVVSYQRLEDLTFYFMHRDSTLSQTELGQKIAEATNSIWILSGNIVQCDPAIIVTSEITDAVTGRILASQRIIGGEGDDIFNIVDMLTDTIRIDLSIPAETELDNNIHIGDATTKSQDAYRHYIEGVDYFSRFYSGPALNSFHKALEYDSTFAMAYLFLARLENRDYIEQAIKYSENNPWKEKRYIKAFKYRLFGDTADAIKTYHEILNRYPYEKDAYYYLGNLAYQIQAYDSSIYYLNKSVEIDPYFRSALNILAYAYAKNGDLDSSMLILDRYAESAPNEPNPDDSRADILARSGRIGEAIRYYKLALEKDSNFTNSIFNLGLLSIINGDYQQARECFRDLASADNSNLRSTGRLYRGEVPLYQGKIKEGLGILADAVAAENLERETIRHASYNHVRAIVYTELGDWDNALAEIRKSMKLHREQFPDRMEFNRCFYIYILAASGDFQTAKAELEKLGHEIEEKSVSRAQYIYGKAAIDFYERNYDAALEDLQISVDAQQPVSFATLYLLGRSYLGAGQYEDALKAMDKMLKINTSDRIYWGPWAVTPYYYRGLVYEKLGDKTKAMADYEKLINLWRNADTDIPILDSAKQRLAMLKDKS